MATNSLVSITTFRKRKSRSRLVEALERFQTEVLLPASMEPAATDSDELEDFLGQVLADHLIEKIESSKDSQGLNQQYRLFAQRLRQTLKTKLRSLARFENLQ